MSRRPVPDRARRRAIRALAVRLGVPYSVAARLLTAQDQGPDDHRAWMSAAREHRSFTARVRDARQAADLPLGRAAHLVTRFPPPSGTERPEGRPKGRETAIAMLYAVSEHESPHLVPPAGELAWAADLGEEAAVDITCANLDRAARQLLTEDRWHLWVRIETALTAGETHPDRRIRDAATTLGRELRSTSLRQALDDAGHTLEALLSEADRTPEPIS